MHTDHAEEPESCLAQRVQGAKLGPSARRRFEVLAAEHDAGSGNQADPRFLFNAWAFVFGPLYYFCFGLWRKGLILLALFILPLFSPDDGAALARILGAEYAGTGTLFAAAGLLFSVLLYSGRTVAALITAALTLGAALYVHPRLPYLDLGVSSGFIWLLSRSIWPVIGATLFFYALTRNVPAVLSTLLAAAVFYKIGFPPQGVSIPLLLSDMIRVLPGLMATRDRFRRVILRKKFWW